MKEKLTKKANNKNFNFADIIFNTEISPTSPNRTLLFSEFLRNKLGEERFNKMKNLLESRCNPMKILEENKDLVSEIIGKL